MRRQTVVPFALGGYTIGAVQTSGDGVRHNRSGKGAGADDSWLPGGARSFLFRLSGGLELRCG